MSTDQQNMPTPEQLQAQMASMAESTVQSSRQIMELEYDFTPKSLQVLDQALAVYHPEGFTFEQGWHGYAAYAGEVVRRALGGKWNIESDGSGASLRGVGGKATIYPFLWVNKRIEAVKAGTSDSKVAAKYIKLLQALGRDAEAPELLPEDFVAKHADKGEGQTSNQQHDDDHDEDQDDDSEADGDSLEFGVDVLKAGPTICFFLVSAADGKIDKKEIKTFFTEVVKFATDANPLVREIFGSTPSQFEVLAKEFMENPSMAVVKVALIRSLAEEHHPQHAAGFCNALIEMSKNIASASGGFFGFGSKISKDEQAALNIIQTMLTTSVKE